MPGCTVHALGGPSHPLHQTAPTPCFPPSSSVVQAAKHAVEDAAEGAMEAVEPGREQVGEVSAAERRPSPLLLPPIPELGACCNLESACKLAGSGHSAPVHMRAHAQPGCAPG